LELTALEIAYIAGGFGILGTLLGSIINHFLSKDISRRNNFNQAAKEFIAAFQKELTRLRLDSTTTYDIIKPALIKHGEAYSIFRRYLEGCARERFIHAWKIYYISTPPCPDEKKTDKEDSIFSQEYVDERKAIIEKIEDLLDFAKFK